MKVEGCNLHIMADLVEHSSGCGENNAINCKSSKFAHVYKKIETVKLYANHCKCEFKISFTTY